MHIHGAIFLVILLGDGVMKAALKKIYGAMVKVVVVSNIGNVLWAKGSVMKILAVGKV